MNQHPPREPVRPAVLSLASRVTALKDATRRLRRWPREAARPSLTAAIRLAFGCSGRDEKTALQPNEKTGLAVAEMRTTYALQKADIFTRHRHRASWPCHQDHPSLTVGHLTVGETEHALHTENRTVPGAWSLLSDREVEWSNRPAAAAHRPLGTHRLRGAQDEANSNQ